MLLVAASNSHDTAAPRTVGPSGLRLFFHLFGVWGDAFNSGMKLGACFSYLKCIMFVACKFPFLFVRIPCGSSLRPMGRAAKLSESCARSCATNAVYGHKANTSLLFISVNVARLYVMLQSCGTSPHRKRWLWRWCSTISDIIDCHHRIHLTFLDNKEACALSSSIEIQYVACDGPLFSPSSIDNPHKLSEAHE